MGQGQKSWAEAITPSETVFGHWDFKTMIRVTRSEALDFPGGPVVKNLPPNARNAGLIPSWGSKIPPA